MSHLAISFLFLNQTIFFWRNFRLSAQLRGRYRHFPCILCPRTCVVSPNIDIPTRVVHVLQLLNEPTFTHHYHPKSIAYLKVHSWCYTFYGLCNDMYALLQYPMAYSHCLKNPLCSSYYSILPPQPLATIDLCTVSIVLYCNLQNVIQLKSLTMKPFHFGLFHLVICI